MWKWPSPLKTQHLCGSAYIACRHLTSDRCKDAIMHLHTWLWRTEEPLDQTRLINNSWETVAQPSCLQPHTPTTTGMLNTHASRHIQQTLYKHNDSDIQELIFHHNEGILSVQNCWHKLAASEVAGCLPNCEMLHVWRLRKMEGIDCHSATEAAIYKAQKRGEAYVAF